VWLLATFIFLLALQKMLRRRAGNVEESKE